MPRFCLHLLGLVHFSRKQSKQQLHAYCWHVSIFRKQSFLSVHMHVAAVLANLWIWIPFPRPTTTVTLVAIALPEITLRRSSRTTRRARATRRHRLRISGFHGRVQQAQACLCRYVGLTKKTYRHTNTNRRQTTQKMRSTINGVKLTSRTQSLENCTQLKDRVTRKLTNINKRPA